MKCIFPFPPLTPCTCPERAKGCNERGRNADRSAVFVCCPDLSARNGQSEIRFRVCGRRVQCNESVPFLDPSCTYRGCPALSWATGHRRRRTRPPGRSVSQGKKAAESLEIRAFFSGLTRRSAEQSPG